MDKRHLILILWIGISCQNESKEIGDEKTLERGKYTCEYTYDAANIKNGKYVCFFPNGTVCKSGTLEADSIKINEELHFFSTGQLKEYRFYNPLGLERYRREYDEHGNVTNEKGDFFSHAIISSTSFSIGDSATLSFFVASPPGTVFKVYGISSSGKYDLNLIGSDSTFLKKKLLYAKKPGYYVFPYEVEFVDTISGISEVRKDEVSFEVTE